MNKILARGIGCVDASGIIPDADTEFPDYGNQYFVTKDGGKIHNLDCYILPSDPNERVGRLRILANDAEIREEQLGDLDGDAAIMAFLSKYKS